MNNDWVTSVVNKHDARIGSFELQLDKHKHAFDIVATKCDLLQVQVDEVQKENALLTELNSALLSRLEKLEEKVNSSQCICLPKEQTVRKSTGTTSGEIIWDT